MLTPDTTWLCSLVVRYATILYLLLRLQYIEEEMEKRKGPSKQEAEMSTYELLGRP